MKLMWLLSNLKAIILRSIITWSEMGQQATQVKKLYSTSINVLTEFPL